MISFSLSAVLIATPMYQTPLGYNVSWLLISGFISIVSLTQILIFNPKVHTRPKPEIPLDNIELKFWFVEPLQIKESRRFLPLQCNASPSIKMSTTLLFYTWIMRNDAVIYSEYECSDKSSSYSLKCYPDGLAWSPTSLSCFPLWLLLQGSPNSVVAVVHTLVSMRLDISKHGMTWCLDNIPNYCRWFRSISIIFVLVWK